MAASFTPGPSAPPADPALPSGKRRPERLDQILDAALMLFYERGYHATSMEDIARRAGMSAGGLYRHFTGKEEILERAMRRAGTHVLSGLVDDGSQPEEANPPQTIQALVGRFVEAVSAHPVLTAVLIGETRALTPTARAWIEDARVLLVEHWAAAVLRLRPDVDRPLAKMMARAAIGLITSLADHPNELTAERVEVVRAMAMAALMSAPDGSIG